MNTTTTTTADVRAELDAQDAAGRLAPSTAGWWKVWGAHAGHIRPGDYVMTRGDEFYVQAMCADPSSPLRVGIVVDGERQSIGAMCPLVILRRDTQNRLA